jgi:hypothetical protein
MISINHFLFLYRHEQLDEFAAWRAYDIMASVRDRHVRAALKALCLNYAGELALQHFMALYEVPTVSEARLVLGAWWLLTQIEKGRRLRLPKRGQDATALAEGAESPPRPPPSPAMATPNG